MTIPVTSSDTHPADMQQIRAWSARLLSNPAHLPISFSFDGTPVVGIPDSWQPSSRRRRIDANIVETVFEGREAKSGLSVRVECVEYFDYPVVEWTAWFTQDGKQSSPLLSDIQALDATVAGVSPVVVHCNGDFASAEGYISHATPVGIGDALHFAPKGGRCCDGAFPYYRIRFKDWGLSLAIGWPAQWAIEFKGLADGVHICAGQEKTHLRLKPGESIRTPRMTVLAWTGDSSRAVNLWRRWYLAHLLPRPDGQPLKPLLACAATDEGEEFTAATEENQIRYIEKFKERGISPDVWWIDAGWYTCYNQNHERRWTITGTWEPDAERFPSGLKPISDCATRNGADLLVWFEPERVVPGSQLDRDHPEWLLRVKDDENLQSEWWRAQSGNSRLLNLGNPECRQWLTDHVCRLIQANGIKIYRQDHNFAPLEYWRKNEAQDRQGVNENLYVQGYLRFWDDLLARNPGLWIDSCSSGGRRNDLETLRRSVPLHYTDYGYGDHPVKLAFQHTLFEWIPYFKECTLSWDINGNTRFDHQVDSFSYHCGMAPMLFATMDIRRDDYDFALAREMIALWRRASVLMLHGDYYPLTPIHRSTDKWVARQFFCPETGEGFVQGIRLPSSPQESLTIHPQGIQSDARYVFENLENGETRQLMGSDLVQYGFTFTLPPRSGALWFYTI